MNLNSGLSRFTPIINFFSVRDWALEARLLRWLTILWVSVGLVVLFSASYPVADAEVGDGARYFKIQIVWILIGFIASRWITRHPLRQLMRQSGIFLLLCLGLILATHIPGLGVTVNGATRWLPLGPFLIQPSELLKPFLVLQGAQLFGRWQRLDNRTRLLWLGLFAICLVSILAQPNLSTTAVCGITLWLIALAAGLPYRQLMLTAGSGLMAAVISVSLKTYQRDRIISFLNPWADPDNNGYQLIQSLLAIGSGELWGTGYGLSQSKMGYLPIQYTDFIFSVYAEEFGFIGCMMLLLFLAVYSTVALIVAMKARSPVHRLVVIGCMVLLVGQSLVNIGVASGALPTTGLPFPLVSYGGSSMVSSLAMAGILVRVAREAQEADVVTMERPLEQPSHLRPEPVSKMPEPWRSRPAPTPPRRLRAPRPARSSQASSNVFPLARSRRSSRSSRRSPSPSARRPVAKFPKDR
ncbi:MAG: FtsW/RodA/SpoVE family cell cycle protein [Leptolyngbya sp. SIO4C1]|nr:FtsW/RodA/SpoVE family cell cycle protein [Leptolyngbya sp. SIO4C1]